MAPLLPEPDADRRRPQQPVRRVGRFGRPRDGPLPQFGRHAAAVESRTAIHAVRQLLHGRLRRFVDEPHVPDFRAAAAVSGRAQASACGEAAVEGRRRRSGRHAPEARRRFARVRARRPAEIRGRRPAHAGRLRREHDGPAVPAELRAAARSGQCRVCGPGRPSRDAAAGPRDDRRSPVGKEHRLGVVQRRMAVRARASRHGHGARFPVPPPAVQLLRELRAGHRSAPQAPARRGARRRAVDQPLHRRHRRGPPAGRHVLQTAGQPEHARGLCGHRIGRPSHRDRDRPYPARPAMGEHRDRDDARRKRRLVGSRRAAGRRPLGPRLADSGARDLAVREKGLRRSHAVRHELDPALHQPRARARAARRRGPARQRVRRARRDAAGRPDERTRARLTASRSPQTTTPRAIR
ncbi:hypothetical protein F01_460002 [Burkholderia cenocepacia]|nr:hypothetical protein F01_460002 [Burkholderia cenocepacia]